MKVQDLRVGNLLTYNNKDFKVLEIHQGKIKAQSNKGIVEFNLSELQPVILTEQRLIEWGFTKSEITKGKYYVEDYLEFTIEDNDWDNPSLNIFIDGKYITCVEFVHELQNLYYALTNEEL